METTITLPIYYKQTFATKDPKNILVGMNWYRNAHFLVTNKIKDHYHNLVGGLLKGKKFRQIRIHYTVFVRTKNTDGHNIRSVIEKFFLDGLVVAEVIKDDAIDYVVGDSSDYRLDKENPRIEITIKEVG